MNSAQRLVRSVPTVTRASDPFKGFKSEQRSDVRVQVVERNEVLEQMMSAWKKYLSLPRRKADLCISEPCYSQAIEIVKKLNYTAKDVENFSILLGQEEQDQKFFMISGLFLSALINVGKDSDYTIHTVHFAEGIWFLGYGNTKNITVHGDTGDYAGEEMKSGNLIVTGNVGPHAATCMEDGNIVIEGNAGHDAGFYLKGGKVTIKGDVTELLGQSLEGGVIIVEGNAGQNVGIYLNGGEIHIKGSYQTIGEVLKGKIFHRGILIVDKKGEIE